MRRQGRWAYYRLSANENIAGNPALLDALVETMCTKRLSDSEIVFLLTAFTHERRIHLIRLLAGGALGSVEIGGRTDYSNSALGRHLRKLRRRGFVALHENHYSLLPQSDPLASVLLQLALVSGS